MQYNFFDEYTFPNHDFINTYIFATIEMDPDHILDHCFVYCKLAETNCYFVRYEASQNLCLLGSLDSTWTEVTTPINEKIFIGNGKNDHKVHNHNIAVVWFSRNAYEILYPRQFLQSRCQRGWGVDL